MIEVRDLSKHYGVHVALSGVSFHADRGEIVGLLGPNGAGKTTLMRILAGYLTQTSGSAEIEGLDVTKDSMAVRSRLGYLPEAAGMHHEMRVIEYLMYRAALKGVRGNGRRSRVDEAMAACGVDDVRTRIIGQLSKGYRQRVSLAAALLNEPKVLILDEPTVGLDPNQQAEIRSLVKQLGNRRTVLFSTHILSEAEAVCERVVIIDRGKLAAEGTLSDLNRKLRMQQLRVELIGDCAPVSAALARIGNLQTEVVSREPTLKILVSGDAVFSREQRAAVSNAITSAGAVILEMAPLEAGLDEIFRRLTVTEAA